MRSFLLLFCILSVTVITKAQQVDKFKAGAYADSLGNRHPGFIKLKIPQGGIFNIGHTYITYKETITAFEHDINIGAIKNFTMGVDSFVVSRNNNISKVPILEVLLDTPVKIYHSAFYDRGNILLHTSDGIYLFGPDPDNLGLITRKNFKEVLSHIMEAKPNAVANIQNGTFTYFYMDDLIKYYKVR
jgi:hypothetical protein